MKVTREDLEFQNGRLVKVAGMRPQYMDGYKLLDVIHALANMLTDAETSQRAVGWQPQRWMGPDLLARGRDDDHDEAMSTLLSAHSVAFLSVEEIALGYVRARGFIRDDATTMCGALTEAGEEHRCPVCAEPIKADDLCSTDIEAGTCHAACLEGSPVVDLETGEPVDGPAHTFRYDECEPNGGWPYQKTFDAISAATSITGGGKVEHGGAAIAISVMKFAEAFGPMPVLSSIPVGWKMMPPAPTDEMKNAVRNIAGAQALAFGLAAYGTFFENASQAPASAEALPTHRHKKRGSTYTLIGMGKMQAEEWVTSATGWSEDNLSRSVDMCEVAVYRSTDDGSIWVRPRGEFEDGRFEALPPAPANGGGQ